MRKYMIALFILGSLLSLSNAHAQPIPAGRYLPVTMDSIADFPDLHIRSLQGGGMMISDHFQTLPNNTENRTGYVIFDKQNLPANITAATLRLTDIGGYGPGYPAEIWHQIAFFSKSEPSITLEDYDAGTLLTQFATSEQEGFDFDILDVTPALQSPDRYLVFKVSTVQTTGNGSWGAWLGASGSASQYKPRLVVYTN